MNSTANKDSLSQRKSDYELWRQRAAYYHDQLLELIGELVPDNKRVLEVGSKTGDLLADLKPKQGVGLEMNKQLVRRAKVKYPQLKFERKSLEKFSTKTNWDYILLADVIDHAPDVFSILNRIREVCGWQTEVVVTTVNPGWEAVLRLGEKLALKRPETMHNRLLIDDLINLAKLVGFRLKKRGYRIVMPKYIPVIADLLNNWIGKRGFFSRLGVIQYLVFTKAKLKKIKKLSCSVVIPAFNEEDNLAECIKRIPQMGSRTEIIVVDDGSTDKTAQVVRAAAKSDNRVKLICLPTNKGKAVAVKAGFDEAKGKVLMILDADMAVSPEELIYFYRIIASGQAEFVNGTRMVYPMEHQAMTHLHRLGNKVFSAIFSWLLSQRVTDTLCGTKVLFKQDYKQIKLGSEPWGDFDLLFGAAKLGLRIKEFPVHYKRRVAGESKMQTFRHGWRLLQMCLKGIYELKLTS